MRAQIITIGDELLIGQVVDTNSAWIGMRLNEIGIDVVKILSISDNHHQIIDTISGAMDSVDIVLITGGLGPTKDDITLNALCEYFDTHLVLSEDVLLNIKRVLGDRISLNPLNQSQAMVPNDCEVLNNRVGTAPATWFERNGKYLISMPGVPQEMKVIMSEEVLPRVVKLSSNNCIIHRNFLVTNIPESFIAQQLESWESALPECLKLAYLPSLGYVKLRLTAHGTDEGLLNKTLRQYGRELQNLLGSNVIDNIDVSLEEYLGNCINHLGLTLSTAESCTGGNIASRITSVAGCSHYYKGSIVAYSNEVKMNVLKVAPVILEKYGAVSEQTVIAMVENVKELLGTNCAIATSGIAGPDGGTLEKPVGTIWIAVSYNDVTRTFKQEINRGREINVERAVNAAFLMLINMLQAGKTVC